MSDTNANGHGDTQPFAGSKNPLPPGVHGAAHILEGYHGNVSLGAGIYAIPASFSLGQESEPEWRDDPASWWLVYSEHREYGYLPLGREDWLSDRQLLGRVHHAVEKSQDSIDALLEGGVEGYLARAKAELQETDSGPRGFL